MYSLLINVQLLFESANLKIVKMQRISTRLLTGSAIFVFLVISTIFKSEMLRSFAINEYTYSVNTFRDAIKNNFSCYLTQDMIDVHLAVGKPKIGNYVKTCYVLDDNDDQRDIFFKIATEKTVTTITRFLKFRFAMNIFFDLGYTDSPIRRFPFQVKFDFLYFYFTKGYPLAEPVAEIMRRMHSGGFTTYFRNIINYKLTKDFNRRQTIQSKKLGLEHVSAAFYILFAGSLLSLVTFLVELVYQ